MHRKKILQEVEGMISNDRNKTHGDPGKQLALATRLKQEIAEHTSEDAHLTEVELEALSSIITKVSRIVSGKPIMDHWQDIAGYAAIAAESRSKQKNMEDNQ